MAGYDVTETQYGFEWGPVEIARVASDPSFGLVLKVETKYDEVVLRITPKGRGINVTQEKRKR